MKRVWKKIIWMEIFSGCTFHDFITKQSHLSCIKFSFRFGKSRSEWRLLEMTSSFHIPFSIIGKPWFKHLWRYLCERLYFLQLFRHPDLWFCSSWYLLSHCFSGKMEIIFSRAMNVFFQWTQFSSKRVLQIRKWIKNESSENEF